jgi:Mg-chelatase subunit ChlD
MTDNNEGFKFKPKVTGLAAQLNQAKPDALIAKTNSTEQKKELPIFAEASLASERIRIIFDDSGSMSGEKIKDARDGCVEFMRNCKPNEVACAVHLMNQQLQTKLTDLSLLTTNLPALSILISQIQAPGETPLFRTLHRAEQSEPKATRFVVFSDGCPSYTDEENYKEQSIALAIEMKTPVDTVLIAHSRMNADYKEYQLLKELADRTGGYFLVFDRNKVNFKEAFKYLAPNLRGTLSDGKVRLALMAGELK